MRWDANSEAVIFRSPGSDKAITMRARLDGSDPEPLPEVAGGAHMSLSPDQSRIMDMIGVSFLRLLKMKSEASVR